MSMEKFFEKLPFWRKSQEGKIFSGEHPLLIFVSSVMTDELSSARNAIVSHVNNVRGFVPWVFEFTPASSEDVEEGYLRKVRESDFVVWLVGGTTTISVEKEIREALSSNKRLLVFLLPADQRDDKTKNLITEVGTRAKWYEVKEHKVLLDALEISISDELIRAVRGKPGLSRIARFIELLNSSRARCIARWQAAGVSLDKAIALYEDKSVGRPPIGLITSLSDKKVVVLTGSFGSGKSLMSERVLQNSIRKSIEDSSSPIPVFIKAQNALEDLHKEVLKSSEGLGNPRIQGAIVIIDGADEAGISASSKILFEARSLVRTWPNTSLIITSRPLPTYSDIEEKIEIDALEEKDIISLVSELENIDINASLIRILPEPVRDAISRPFFTLLWARYLRQQRDGRIRTIGELINYFIEDVIQFSDENISNAMNLLEILSSKSIDYGGNYVPWREIGTNEEINLLLETRLIEKVDGKIGFPLPILAQWFAAHSLVNEKVDIIEIARDLPRLDRWHYPLIVVVSLFSHKDVSKILTPVVISNPGLAAEIIDEGITRFGLENGLQLPSARECGMRIRQVHSAWISGIGDVANYISPISEDGSLHSTGVTTSENRLLVAWYKGEDEIDELIELPVGYMGNPDREPGWYKTISGVVGYQSAWAWKWCLDDLTNELGNFISRKAYVCIDGHMFRETLWGYALDAMRFGDLYDKPIILDQLEPRVLERINLNGNNQHTKWHDLLVFIQKQKKAGEGQFRIPWPCSDIELNTGGWIWERYSEEQVLKRAKVVYTAALEEYENIANSLFTNLKPRMLIGTLLPIKMHGQIRFIDSSSWRRRPGLNWYFEPLPVGSDNVVDFTLNGNRENLIDPHDLLIVNQKMRPDSKEWISAFTSFSVLDIFNASPITGIVYGWLEADLRRIKWLK